MVLGGSLVLHPWVVSTNQCAQLAGGNHRLAHLLFLLDELFKPFESNDQRDLLAFNLSLLRVKRSIVREVLGHKTVKIAVQLVTIAVKIDLGRGSATQTIWTCDLSHDYVSINADYRS